MIGISSEGQGRRTRTQLRSIATVAKKILEPLQGPLGFRVHRKKILMPSLRQQLG